MSVKVNTSLENRDYMLNFTCHFQKTKSEIWQWFINSKGKAEGDTSFENFTSIEPDQKTASKLFEEIPDEKVYITVRCTNGADVTHTCYSDGVKLLHSIPSIDGVILELLTTSQTQYMPRERYHGNNTEIRFRWTGFDPDEGVQSYMVWVL
jgi:hypothetical protein